MGWGWAISWVKETNHGVGLGSFMGERDKLWGGATRAPDLIPGLSVPPLSINGEGGIGLEWG